MFSEIPVNKLVCVATLKMKQKVAKCYLGVCGRIACQLDCRIVAKKFGLM